MSDRPPARLPRVLSGHRFLAVSGAVVGVAVAGGMLGRVIGAPAGVEEPRADDVGGSTQMLRGPGGSRVFTERWAGRDDTIVFIHGWCLNESVWVQQKRRFGRGPYSMVTWDLPGHGESSPPRTGPVTPDLLVEALARVVDETTSPEAGTILVGHSLGGLLALKYVASNPEAARRRIRGLVLLSTPLMNVARSMTGGWPGAAAESWLLGNTMHLIVGSRGIDRVLAWETGRDRGDSISYRIVRTGFGDAPTPGQIRLIRDAIGTVRREVRRQTFRAMSGFDASLSLSGVNVPTLVMLGTKDRVVNPADTRALARGLPEATLIEYPGAGHGLFLERAEEFNQALATFARARLRRRARGTDTA